MNVLSDRLEIRLNSFTFSVTYLLCQIDMRLACAYFFKSFDGQDVNARISWFVKKTLRF